MRLVGDTVLVAMPQGRLCPTDLGLTKEEMLNEYVCALVPRVLLAMKEKTEELVGDMDEALHEVQEELVVMNLVSEGTSTWTINALL